MRFLILQENGRHAISKHLRECNSLQRSLIYLGEYCDVWGPGHETFTKTIDFNSYDVIINLENYDFGWVPDLSTITKPVKLLWAIDSHYKCKSYYTNIFYAGKYTKTLEATKYFLDGNSVWFPNCYDSDFISPLEDVEKTFFIGFCGNVMGRGSLFNALSQFFPDFRLDIDVRGINMIKAINSYCIHFNKNISNDINYRSFETLGCGTLLLTNYNEQYEDLGFKEGENFYSYKDINEAIEKIRFLKNNPDIVNEVAKRGHIFGVENHSFKKRAQDLLEIIKKL